MNRNLLSIVQGHHYGIGRQYKLSVPIGEDATENSQVYVYDHTPELYGRPGAWSRFDNHPAIGWANLAQDAYFATHTGRVMVLRRQGDDTDYRDDASPIQFSMLTRALDMGIDGVRKVLDSVVIHYRTTATSTNTTLKSAVNLSNTYMDTTPFRMPNPRIVDNLSEQAREKVMEIRHAIPNRREVHYQFLIENGAIDEPIEIVGIMMRAAAMTDRGIRQAAQTTSPTR